MSSQHVSDKAITARKAHECRLCGERIERGEPCHVYNGVESGVGFYSIHFHPECWRASRDFDSLDWECAPPLMSRQDARELQQEPSP